MSITRRTILRASVGTAALLGFGHGANMATAQELRGPAPLVNSDFEPIGGQPPQGAVSSIGDFDYQVKYQRAFEAALWAMPALAIYRFRAAALQDLGLKDNDIIAYSGVATAKLEATTANASTPYITAFTDLQAGPTVLEIPPAGDDGSLYGQVVDAWQYTIADVGPSGLDQGKGGKYLFTPPGYEGEIPEEYLHVPSPNFRVAFAFRSVKGPGMTDEDAYAYAKRLRMYPLSQAENPPEQRFFDPLDVRYPTMPEWGLEQFESLHAIVSVEPVKPEDKLAMGMLTSLGIRHGEPFEPDEVAKRAMIQASYDVWFYMQEWFDKFPKEQLFWPDRQYASLLQADENNMFTWTYEDRIDTIERAAEYFWCTYMPKILSDSPATQYLMSMADSDGNPLVGGQTYRLDVPAEMPVEQFWALTVYDRATMGFIYTAEDRTTLSSYDLDTMEKNEDGGVSIWIGPTAPEGKENNWIPTAGKRPLPAMRLYGPTAELNEKRFKLADFVRV
ncbi:MULTISPECIES: DUF1254 domain-containing protein [Halocynthiibacter]|uniref:DUF1214 domain-containing protein n=1 Tax=Halocynthiibacter halioticoli TaxID=2986804 RepID=A0AAE3J0Q4_9RHOB|nr:MULTISPECIES: DUF1214 domain-containing protein [Halocynthiibacter]MCV6825534.1 DUF1214 domain-containing protein [Halocynthiibacter halioticoli]MCW4058535.1 DUF1214 domain-containing protein [Halocynthiibacter sp. SDUM655004]